MATKTSVQFTSKGIDYETPSDIFDPLDDEFHFTLDVAASHTNAKCDNYYTEEDDALTQSWIGTCWMNPPYGRALRRFVKKAYESAQCGSTVVCLIPVRANTKWWHQYVMRASEIRLINGEVKFVGHERGLWWAMCIVVFKDSSGPPRLASLNLRR